MLRLFNRKSLLSRLASVQEKNANRHWGGLSDQRSVMLETMESRLLMTAVTENYELEVLPLPDPTRDLASTITVEQSSGTVSYALSDTFLLQTRPGANQTIYLDFDGHVTSGTQWNTSYEGGADFVTPAFDTDGNTASFSDTELQRIQDIWARVAEDFAPFDVNVSTLAPATADLMKSGTGDTKWGVRVCIGGSSFDWFGSSAGGVAYVGSFNSSLDTPTYAFTAQLGNGSEKSTAEAISHEAGHTLGLNHDGTATLGYYEGHGSGETGWAPIMGVGYYQNLSQWSKGEYTGANRFEDDLTIITTNNGFGYRADDFGGTIATSGALTVAGSSVSGSGLIERTTDVDLFAVTAGAGNLTLNISPATRGPNLDILAQLLDGNGNIIATSNPADLLSASLNLNVAAGTYYLRIDGTGKGDPLTTGYTDYGSLGQYSISGSIVPAGASLSINNVTVNESAGLATFTVTLSQASASVVTVDLATANGSAIDGSDFSAVTILGLTFNPGVTSQTITVPILNDSTSESTESFTVNLSNASGAVISDAQGTGTINDDDVVPATLAISNASVNETNPLRNGGLKTTNMVYTVTLSAASSSAVSVQYASANGTAIAGSDYFSTSGTLTFNAGEISKTITVQVIGDKLVESSETILMHLSNASGAAIANSQGIGTIIDNDSKGGKPGAVAGAAAGESADGGAISASLLASLATIVSARPASAAVNAFQKHASSVLTQTPAPLFIFEIFKSDSSESGLRISEVKRKNG